MTLKAHQDPKGGLNSKGRAYYKAKTGANLKPPVTKTSGLTDKEKSRRKSFCARMSGVKGAMKDSKGNPTRKALALRKWKCGSV